MAKSAAAKKPSKQLPIFEVQPVTEAGLMTDAERQEKYRLKQVAKALDEKRRERWTVFNAARGYDHRRGARDCPCTKCVAHRRAEARAK